MLLECFWHRIRVILGTPKPDLLEVLYSMVREFNTFYNHFTPPHLSVCIYTYVYIHLFIRRSIYGK